MLNMHPMGAIFIISEYIRFGTTPLIIGRGGERRRMRPLLLAVRAGAGLSPAASFFLPEGEGAQQKTYGTGEP